MSFEAQMRIGSLEVSAALGLVAAFALRPRASVRSEVDPLAPMRLRLRAVEFGDTRTVDAVCPLVVGRTGESGLTLPDPEVSRRHARFETENGAVYLRDLGSRNGTFLNGRRLSEAIEIRAGDTIDVGATRLIVEGIAPWK